MAFKHLDFSLWDCRASLAMTPPPSVIARHLPLFVVARSEIPRLRFGTGSAISGTIGVVSKQYYVYMMTNSRNTVIYVGVTNDLIRRVYEHKEKVADGFTRKYNVTKLVYYEVFEDIENAILREKQIKAGSRQKKVQLINSLNREWHDLYDELWDCRASLVMIPSLLCRREATSSFVVARHDSAEAISVGLSSAGDCHAPTSQGSQ